MGKSLINKHIDNASGLTRELFNDELRKAKGEIIINNDPDNPSIFIVDNNNQVVKISGSGSYDDTELRTQISANTESIEKINKELQNWKEGTYDDTELRNLISGNTERIDAIEANGVSTVLQEPITVAGLTGVFGAGNYNNNDVTNNYHSSQLEWSFHLKDSDFTEDNLIIIDETYSLKDENQYKCKFKFNGDESYLNERITVTVKLNNLSASADLDIVS